MIDHLLTHVRDLAESRRFFEQSLVPLTAWGAEQETLPVLLVWWLTQRIKHRLIKGPPGVIPLPPPSPSSCPVPAPASANPLPVVRVGPGPFCPALNCVQRPATTARRISP